MTNSIPVAGARPSVLFLCVHNAGRSQMAAGFLRRFGGGRIDVLSAGSSPGDAVNTAAVAAMEEKGIDIGSAVPRRWTEAELEAVDVVITMGCGDECPYLPDTVYEDWPLADPAGQGVDAVRPIRDEIEERVRDLVGRLGLPLAEE